MNDLKETVRQESAALYRFVDSVIRLCTDINEYPVYPRSSRSLFAKIKRLGEETKAFLNGFPAEAAKDARTAFSKRLKLSDLRAHWETVHEYLKPVLDADTLHLPAPLTTVLQDAIESIDDLKDITFTVFLINELNYLQVPSGILIQRANDIADLIKGTRLPPRMGVVGIPYSQANGFFLNCLLPHEMGHFVYQEHFVTEVVPEIDKALETLEKDIGHALNEEDITMCRDLLESWIEEIFCDLFAICLIGPAYSFALIELTDATHLIGEPKSQLSDFHFFIQDHPAEMARFEAHFKLLKQLGWWPVVDKSSSAFVDVLRKSASPTKELHIEYALPVDEERFLKCYFEVCEWLLTFLPTKVAVSTKEITSFENQSPKIYDYLKRAIVPSTIILRKKVITPSPIVLINAGFFFYLDHMADLISNIAGKDPKSVDTRSQFTERLELWILKALEDSRLLRGEK
ncbi:MAG TPA: hypothetical protein VIB39_20235 [Candidatus Angelobacter sp.]